MQLSTEVCIALFALLQAADVFIYRAVSCSYIREPFRCPFALVGLHVLVFSAVDEMGGRIDDLEKSIAELMQQAGIEEGEGAPK